jgi:hypothetical protein
VATHDLIPLNGKESLTPAQFSALCDILPELEWLANITNPKTRRFYKRDVHEFLAFTGLKDLSAVRTFPWFAGQPEFRTRELTWIRARLGRAWGSIQSVLSSMEDAFRHALIVSAGAHLDSREAMLGQLARFGVLQVIRFLQFTDSYLPDEGPVPHTSFPTLPLVPRWLVDLVPSQSALGELVFKESRFLLARVGVSEASYENLVIPRYRGQLIHQSQSVGDEDLYYKWIVPQWIHYGCKRPLPGKTEWHVWVLTDDLHRGCYLASSKRPWEE